MNRKSLIVCILVGILAYSLGAAGAGSKDRPILRWVSKAVGLWLVFRDAPPPPANEARYVHLEPGAVDHRNAL